MEAGDSKLLEEFIRQIQSMKLHRASTLGAALKKPLLLLLLVSRIENQRLDQNRFHFSDVRGDLDVLIRHFGGRPTKSGAKPEQPFYHLRTSPFWKIHTTKSYAPGVIALTSDLMAPDSYAAFEPAVFRLLRASDIARARVVDTILEEWWPPSLHGDLRDELGLDALVISNRRRRNQQFALEVLKNFAYSCAFCGFHGVLNRSPTGVDAAHVHWHSANGPDEVENGIALCKLHHWAFDKGVLGLKDNQQICVAGALVIQADGGLPIESLAGRELAVRPRRTGLGKAFLEWHRKNVYLGI